MRRRPSRLVAVDRGGAGRGRLRSPGVRHAAGGPGCAAADGRRPAGQLAPLPEASPDETAVVTFDGLDTRIKQATADAAAKGADITTVVLDRSTGQRITNGNGRGIAIASVVKLFIADDLLMSGPPLSPGDQKSFESMLRSSDDSAARGLLEPGRRQCDHHPCRGPLRAQRHPATEQRTMVQHHQHSRRPGALLRHDAVRRRAACPRDKADMIVDNLAKSSPTGNRRNDAGGRVPAAIRHSRRALRRARRRQTGLDVLYRF